MQYQNYNPNEYQEEPKSVPEVILGNILKAVVCIFLIAVGFFLVVLLVSSLNTQTAVDFTTYTQDFAITNPTLSQTVYTHNPLLSSVVVTKYNSTNSSYGGVPSGSWSYDSDKASLTVNAGVLAHDITAIKVSANTDYSEVPTESVFTAMAIALIVLALCGIFGIIGWKYVRR